MKIPIGVIGCGRMAQRFHIKNLLKMENVELTALCDVREKIAREIASKYRIKAVYSDYKDLLSNEEIKAVIVSTLPESHFKILKDAAEAGKHIFVEKPMTTTIEECKIVNEVCRRNGVKLMVGFMRRFDKALIWSKDKICSGELGKTFAINSVFNHVSTYGDYLQKTDDDIIGKGSSISIKPNMPGFLSNHLIHHVDIIWWIGGSVDRLLATSIFNDGHFTFNIILKFLDKSTGYMQFNGFIKTDWQEALVIHGTKGSLYIKMFFPYLDTPSNAVLVSHEVGSRVSPLDVVNTMYKDEIRHFLNCIINDSEPEPNGYQALEVQKTISAIEESLEHESWIDIE